MMLEGPRKEVAQAQEAFDAQNEKLKANEAELQRLRHMLSKMNENAQREQMEIKTQISEQQYQQVMVEFEEMEAKKRSLLDKKNNLQSRIGK